ncbi:MAG TPA: CoA-binding protein [Dehalococcoidia bacterium]|jgi:acyl-CoA synthetase (NDP forming)|nr:CoA-binding protein [Dehalococcoidia bacterium]
MPQTAERPADLLKRLDRAFNPRTVAVVGDKRAMGYLWLNCMKTFDGKAYSVQVDPNEIPGIEAMGVRNYKTLLEIPDEIDYVVCAVPRPVAARIIADCVEKKVGAVMLFTSGFAETETEDGIAAQEQITQMARESGLLLIGPNCMGIYNRRLGVRHSTDQAAGDAGNVGFISQSGTHAINFSLVGGVRGVKCSKTVSFGNAVVLDAPDYIEYLANDPETEVIAMYVEGTRDGRRFFRTLRETARRKPVVVWKGGVTAAGSRAVYSHTASLATAPAIWDAAMRQAGVVQTDGLDETIDAVNALTYCKPTTGHRMGLIAMTGGQSVVITDAFEREGLEVPLLSAASYENLASFFNIIGGSYRNPLDAGGTIGMGFVPGNLQKLFDILEEDENVDAIAMEVGATFIARRMRENPAILENFVETLAKQNQRSRKPFLAIAHPGHVEDVMAEMRAKLFEHGVATFTSFGAAARAQARAVAYRQAHDEAE